MHHRSEMKLIPMEGELKNVGRVWLIVIASLCYCHFIAAKFPKGKWRLISLMPIFYIFTLVPLYTTSFFFTFVTAAFITWFSSFKLLLFAFDRGPIAPDPTPKSLPVFLATAALPFKIKSREKNIRKKSTILPLYLATEIPFTALIFYDYKQSYHPCIVLITYCCAVFVLIEILINLCSSLVHVLLGLDVEAPSDEPYLSTSLRDFWGRRWNLAVTSLLRQTVFVPVRSAAAAVMDGDMATCTGVVATFIVSGVAHEVLFWYVIRGPPSWEMTMFFVVHGVCVVVEFKMAKWRLPSFVAAPMTVGFVVWTSSWLFFPPLMRNAVDVRLTKEMRFVMEAVKGSLAPTFT